MNYSSLGPAALGAVVAYFAFGFLLLWLAAGGPGLREVLSNINELGVPHFSRFSRSGLPRAILVVAIIFAMITTQPDGSNIMEGARLGVLIGIFVVCAFVLHNYVNLNIGLKLALGQAVAYFVQWSIVGIVIGLIYKPLATP